MVKSNRENEIKLAFPSPETAVRRLLRGGRERDSRARSRTTFCSISQAGPLAKSDRLLRLRLFDGDVGLDVQGPRCLASTGTRCASSTRSTIATRISSARFSPGWVSGRSTATRSIDDGLRAPRCRGLGRRDAARHVRRARGRARRTSTARPRCSARAPRTHPRELPRAPGEGRGGAGRARRETCCYEGDASRRRLRREDAPDHGRRAQAADSRCWGVLWHLRSCPGWPRKGSTRP